MKLEVNGQVVNVHVVARATIAELHGLADGHADIFIGREDPRWERVDTLLHELFHTILAPLKLNSRTEEKYVTALARGLTQVLRDNPEWNPRSDYGGS